MPPSETYDPSSLLLLPLQVLGNRYVGFVALTTLFQHADTPGGSKRIYVVLRTTNPIGYFLCIEIVKSQEFKPIFFFFQSPQPNNDINYKKSYLRSSTDSKTTDCMIWLPTSDPCFSICQLYDFNKIISFSVSVSSPVEILLDGYQQQIF